jgi:RNA polymerase sigma-70 factor (ECF subfamily)
MSAISRGKAPIRSASPTNADRASDGEDAVGDAQRADVAPSARPPGTAAASPERMDGDDDTLFAQVLAARAQGQNAGRGEPGRALGVLLDRWRRPAIYVIRRVLASYRRSETVDPEELFQEAACKLVERGLDQFRGHDEEGESRAGASRTFFLRIVKHAAIDHCRRRREELAPASPDGEEPEHQGPEIGVAVERARQANAREEAVELYWKAFARLEAEHPNEASAWKLYHHDEIGDHEACAKALGITVVNSYKRISRAQAHLRLFLLELQDGAPTQD